VAHARARQFPESRPLADTYKVFPGQADATPAKNIEVMIATRKADPPADSEVRDLAWSRDAARRVQVLAIQCPRF
jgi:hypothetical protein